MKWIVKILDVYRNKKTFNTKRIKIDNKQSYLMLCICKAFCKTRDIL